MLKQLNEKSIKIAVIGTGGWGKNHVRVLNDLGYYLQYAIQI